MSRSIATLFHFPTCSAKYEVVGFEAPPRPATEGDVACLCCGGPLHAREGKFLLKYFLYAPAVTREAEEDWGR